MRKLLNGVIILLLVFTVCGCITLPNHRQNITDATTIDSQKNYVVMKVKGPEEIEVNGETKFLRNQVSPSEESGVTGFLINPEEKVEFLDIPLNKYFVFEIPPGKYSLTAFDSSVGTASIGPVMVGPDEKLSMSFQPFFEFEIDIENRFTYIGDFELVFNIKNDFGEMSDKVVLSNDKESARMFLENLLSGIDVPLTTSLTSPNQATMNISYTQKILIYR